MTYIVQTASECMPNSCWGVYRRVAVLRLAPGATSASMISPRARGVEKIVREWRRLNVGKTERGAYQVALAEAQAIAERLNGDFAA